MPFKSGESGNRLGRPEGSTNVVTNELRSFILEFLNNNLEGIQTAFDELEPKDKLLFIEKLFKYVIPKQTETNLHTCDAKQITGMVVL